MDSNYTKLKGDEPLLELIEDLRWYSILFGLISPNEEFLWENACFNDGKAWLD
jgi:hypothetical protein